MGENIAIAARPTASFSDLSQQGVRDRRLTGDRASLVSDDAEEVKMCSRNWTAFWWMGMINNMPYVVILAGAKKIADKYDEKNLMPLLSWALVAFGFVVSTINTFLLPGMSYRCRFSMFAIGTALGLVLVGLADHVGSTGGAHFGFAIFGTVTLGSAASFGESVALGYMHRFPRGMVGGWSAGTGMSGVLGSGLFLGLHSAGLSVAAIMYITTSFVALYLFAFFVGIKEPSNIPEGEHLAINTGEDLDEEEDDEYAKGSGGMMSPSFRKRLSWERIRGVHRKVFYMILQMYLVYVFEYAVQNSASYVQPCTYHGEKIDDSGNWFVANFYTISQFAYQVGVLCSRSSLAFVKIRKVEVLSFIQLLNMAVWLVLAKSKWMGDPPYLYILLPMMWIVGLLGGASYVNVFNLIQSDPNLDRDDVELAMNIGSLYVNLGIVTGCVLVLVFANTVLAGEDCSDDSSSGGMVPMLAPMLAPLLAPMSPP